ncbi:MAG: hypothetical protein V7K70_22475, partial [Nostoc sp.]
KRHRWALIKTFEIQKHGVPSYSTIRRVIMGVNFEKLVKIFNHWAQNYVDITESEWLSVDGKSIKKEFRSQNSGVRMQNAPANLSILRA